MKKKTLLSLSMLLFAGMMWYNIEQVPVQETSNLSDFTEVEMVMTTTIALANGCGNCWQNGVKSTSGFGLANHILCNCTTANGSAGPACVCKDNNPQE